jgi:hypothetical protein
MPYVNESVRANSSSTALMSSCVKPGTSRNEETTGIFADGERDDERDGEKTVKRNTTERSDK